MTDNSMPARLPEERLGARGDRPIRMMTVPSGSMTLISPNCHRRNTGRQHHDRRRVRIRAGALEHLLDLHVHHLVLAADLHLQRPVPRPRPLSGWAKAAWILFVIVLPYLGIFVYLIVRGHGIGGSLDGSRAATRAQFDDYVRQTASAPSSATDRVRRKQLLDQGAITQEEFDRLKSQALTFDPRAAVRVPTTSMNGLGVTEQNTATSDDPHQRRCTARRRRAAAVRGARWCSELRPPRGRVPRHQNSVPGAADDM